MRVIDPKQVYEIARLNYTDFALSLADLTSLREVLEDCDTIEVPRWIPVTERLPDSQADVLVVAFWHERWQTMIGWHSDSGKKWRVITPHGEYEPGGVTHWMPLPAPPKDGDT